MALSLNSIQKGGVNYGSLSCLWNSIQEFPLYVLRKLWWTSPHSWEKHMHKPRLW